ncbi:MAG: hypothetical protein N3D73_02455 [Candidatus Diapherotrites archaeon]|nr:hypothetical protein [Candidatus Diapherotrites archaeon]
MVLKIKNIYLGNYKRLMIIPIAIFVLSLICIFIYPRVSLGIDFTGGNRLLLKTDKQINATDLKNTLLLKYPLRELSVVSTSNPLGGYGIVIEYSKNEDFEIVNNKINSAAILANSNKEEAFTVLNSIYVILQKYDVNERVNSKQIEEAIVEAKSLVSVANENFIKDVESLIKKKYGVSNIETQRREVGASLGKAFIESSIWIVFFSCLAIFAVVLIFFREIIPSLAIISAALIDISFALAVMSIADIPISLSSIASLLMLFGYSVDTDILLTTRSLKRKEGSVRERAFDSMVTGLTMTTTALASLFVMLLFSYLYQISVIFEIAIVLSAGLLADIPATWLFNAPLIIWYVESKGVVK